MDLFERLENNKGPLGTYKDYMHDYFIFPKLEGELGSRMSYKGKERIVWSLNNYLGLANHPEVRKVDAQAAADWGLAYPMGSRMMTGNSNLHDELERKLSEFVHKEDTMLLNFGYQGIMSAIDAVVTRHDVIVYDAECHACIVDGVRLHQGKRYVFTHNNMESLEKQLKRATEWTRTSNGGILVITEGVFGMAGDQGRLREIVALKEQYDFRLMVDDAHGFGTMGQTGAGTGEQQNVQEDIDIYFSTFAKSMASIGAFISSTKDVVDFLRYNTRSQIFAKSLPMPLVIGNMKRLEMLRTQPQLKERLWSNVNKLQGGLREMGFDLGKTDSPVTPVHLRGELQESANIIWDLRETYGIFCSAVMYPVIPKGFLVLRFIPTAAHTDEDIQATLEAFKAVGSKKESGVYRKEKYIEFDVKFYGA